MTSFPSSFSDSVPVVSAAGMLSNVMLCFRGHIYQTKHDRQDEGNQPCTRMSYNVNHLIAYNLVVVLFFADFFSIQCFL